MLAGKIESRIMLSGSTQGESQTEVSKQPITNTH